MSGFEVLGVVLGTIPLIISALEHYQEGLGTIRRWHFYEAELQSLKRRLGNENAIFINTCQLLLSGVVGSVQHEKLVDEPFGEFWRTPEIRDQIALRLDHVFETFETTVVAMNIALGEIKTKLGLDDRGEVKWKEGKSIVREIKRATFTIKRSQYDNLLDTISKGNQDLKTLTNQSIQLEPERRVEYHGKLFSQLKEVSRSMYRALRNSITCDCPGSHQLSLRLAKPNLRSRNEQEQIRHNSKFDCALSYHKDYQNDEKHHEAWSLVVVRIYEPPLKQFETVPSDTINHKITSGLPNCPLLFNIDPTEISKKTRSVKFSVEGMSSFRTKTSVYTVTETMTTRPMATISAPFAGLHIRQEQHLADLVNLCHAVCKGKQGQQVDCFGLISDSTSQRYPKFGVHPLPDCQDEVSMISLREILEDGENNLPSLSYADGLKLAIDISSGVLQLSKTSWLPDVITSRDILFLSKDDCPSYSQAFIAKKLLGPDQQAPPESKASHMQAIKRTMFSLGILLLEIQLFKTLDQLWNPTDEKGTRGAVGQFSDLRAAADLLHQIQAVGSPKFYSSVRRFLFCEFTSMDAAMGDEAFCKEVYGKTIALLEEDHKSSQSLW